MADTQAALRAIAATFRSLADELDVLLDSSLDPPADSQASSQPAPHEPGRVFDPQRDRPTVTPAPTGAREQVDWCGLMFFGQLAALNVREQRGATVSEQLAIARAAGYQDRRAFAGWPWTWTDRDGGRWITDDDELTENDKARGRSSGIGFLRWYAEALGVRLPDDLASRVRLRS